MRRTEKQTSREGEARARRQLAELEGVNRILTAALTCETEEALGAVCLAVAEEITQCRCGITGEVNARSVQDLAATQPGWEALAPAIAQAFAHRRAEAARHASEARLAEELADTRRLTEISAAFIEQGDDLYAQIVDVAVALMHAECASLQIYDPERAALRLLAHRGFTAQAADFWAWVSPSSASACGRALRDGARVVVPDVAACPELAGSAVLAACAQAGIRAVQTTPLYSRDGTLVGMLSTHWRAPHQPAPHALSLLDLLARQAADLIERKQAEEALRDREAQFRLLADRVRTGIVIIQDGVIQYANPHVLQRGGWQGLDLLGQPLERLIHPAFRARVRDAYQRRLRGEEVPARYELECVGKDEGSTGWFDFEATVIDFRGRPAVLATAHEITAHKQLEEALRRSEERLRLATSAAQMYAWEIDLATGTFAWSGEAEWFTLASPPRTLDDAWAVIHPDDRAEVQRRYAAAFAQDGEFTMEYRVAGRAPGEDLWLCSTGVVITGADGRPARAVGVTQNITARKRIEQALKDADRAKDEFLSILSHELRTPITSIIGWSAQALKQPAPELLLRALEIVQRNAHRQKAMVDGLLDISRLLNRKIELQRARVDLRAEAGQAVESLQVEAGERLLALTCLPGDDPLPVSVDPERLQQCLGNLLQNSLKFTPPGGEITVTCARVARDAVLRVRDTGRGLTAQALPVIFRPFRQIDRDERAGGLGLGLAITRGLVELHGGAITADSPGPAQGSTFTITLPLAE